jgi:ATP/maltotriose-dependent transcriptional regulator MalT
LHFAEQGRFTGEAHTNWHQLTSLVDTYVAEEMLDQTESELATFMLDVIDLPVLRADLITYAFERDDAGQVLQQLVHSWQWLEPTEEHDLSFRVPSALHASLQRLAHHRSPATLRHRRIDRAIEWFEQHGNPEHALVLSIRAHRWGRARKLVRNDAQEMFDASLMAELIAHLERLPLDQILCHRELGFWFTMATIFECREELARKCIRVVERDHAEVHGSGRMALYLALMATLDFDRYGAIEHARNARRELEERDRHWANLVLWVWDHRSETPQAFARPAESSRWTRLPWQTPWWQRVVVPAYANHLAHLGDVTGAGSQYELLLQSPGATANVARLQLAQRDLMQGDLAGAEAHLARIDHAASANQPDFDLAMRLASARIQQYRGRHVEAGALLAAIGRDATLGCRWNMLYAARAAQADLWLSLGQTESAQYWEKLEVPPGETPLPHWFGDICPQVIVAKLRLKEGNPAAAQDILLELIPRLQEQSLQSLLPEVYFVLAQVHAILDAGNDVIAALETALWYGGAGNIRLPFLTSDFDLLSWLHRIDRTSLSGLFVDGLIWSLQARENQRQVPVLTAREREILELVSEGQMNKEIAQRLFVSEYTIKNHLVNIGRKLSTGTRSAAVDRARQLGLLRGGSGELRQVLP